MRFHTTKGDTARDRNSVHHRRERPQDGGGNRPQETQALWEDIEDVLVSRSRRHEKRIPLEKVEAGLIGLYQLNMRVPAGLAERRLSDQLTAGKFCHAVRRVHNGEELSASYALRKKSDLRSD